MTRFNPFSRGLASLACAFLLATCGKVGGGAPAALPNPYANADGQVSVWASSADQSRKLSQQANLRLVPAGSGQAGEIVIEPERTAQEITGFGAAMTDASAHLFQNVLSRQDRDVLFAELFGPQGLGLSFVRVPIGASDFSSEHYSLNDMPAGQVDPELRQFSMRRAEQSQIPALKAVRAINPRLTLMASPWSAPGWMKSSGSLIKGSLKPEFYAAYARYFVRYLDGMEAAGLPVRYVSMQNEPAFEPSDYPGMKVTAPQRAAFYSGHLGPALAARAQRVGILDWDHNWDKPDEPLAVLADPAAARYVEGVAWHCYAGDSKVMATVKAAHPNKDLFFTECSGGDWAPDWGGTLGWMTEHLIIAPIRAGGKGAILWNLALDEKRGPHLGGCGNCRGVVSIDSRTHTVTRNVEYYVLGQVSRFVRPGARVVASSGGPAGLKFATFRNVDATLVLIAINPTKAGLPIAVKVGTSRFRTTMPAGEVMTFIWPEPAGRT
jgi:glucosylceramidase